MSENTVPTPNEIKPLTEAEAYQLGGAYARLDELKKQAPSLVIINGNGQESTSGDATKLSREAEIEALTEFLVRGMLDHAAELLGAFFAMRSEYIPLVRALVPVLRHAQAQPAQPAALSKAVQQEAAAHARLDELAKELKAAQERENKEKE